MLYIVNRIHQSILYTSIVLLFGVISSGGFVLVTFIISDKRIQIITLFGDIS